MDLRPYQAEAIVQASQGFASGIRSQLIVAPTGAGKTVIAAAMMKRMIASGKRVLFLAHRRELIKQTREKLEAFGCPCGLIMAGFRPSRAELIQVASIQTLARRELPEFDYLIVDEAHHVTKGNAYGRLIKRCTARVVGLTATPFRLDGRGLGDVFERYISTRTPGQLRDEGFLCAATGWIYRPLSTAGVRTVGGDFDQSQLANLENTILGDVVEEWLKHFRTSPVRTILFACGVKHSKQFVEAFRAAGVAAEHVDGDTPTAERDAILERVRRGETTVLSNCNVATEGFDLPQLTCIILARPTKSLCMYLQQVGRVLRTAPGKLRAIIHDHAGCMMAHGPPYDETREFIPTKSKKKRELGLPPQLRCQQCGAVSEEDPCPECGFKKRPEVVRSDPTTVIDGVEAVPLEQIEREMTEPSRVQGIQRFKKWGDTLIGDFLRFETGEGMYGMEKRWWFKGAVAPFYIPAPADLHAKLHEASPKPGDRCRMQYVKDRPGRSYEMKIFKLFIRRTQEAAA